VRVNGSSIYDLSFSDGNPHNVKIVSERLGHSTTRLTLDTYSHVLATMQEKTSAKLEDMLYSQTGS